MFILQNEHRFSRMMPSNPSDEYHPLYAGVSTR